MMAHNAHVMPLMICRRITAFNRFWGQTLTVCQNLTGVPTNCDYECALVYPPMYARCKGLMRSLLGPARMPSFDRLVKTCQVRPFFWSLEHLSRVVNRAAPSLQLQNISVLLSNICLTYVMSPCS